MNTIKKGLGRGLSSLIGETKVQSKTNKLSLGEIIPNKYQPKRKNRFVLAIEGIDSFLIQESARPDFKMGEKKLDFINEFDDPTDESGDVKQPVENVGVGDAALNYYKLLAQITKRARG